MNKEQRKYLSDKISDTVSKEIERIKTSTPAAPSVTHHIVTAIMTGTIKYKFDTLVETVRSQITESGVFQNRKKGARIVEGESERWGGEQPPKTFDSGIMQLPLNILFEEPESYREAHANWRSVYDANMDKIRELQAKKDTLMLKINVGSSSALEKLVEQVDNMGDLLLINGNLSIDSGKQLGNGGNQ